MEKETKRWESGIKNPKEGVQAHCDLVGSETQTVVNHS